MFERVTNKLPLYLALAIPAAGACVWALGPEWGAAAGCAANLALWHILLRPPTEDQEENA